MYADKCSHVTCFFTFFLKLFMLCPLLKDDLVSHSIVIFSFVYRWFAREILLLQFLKAWLKFKPLNQNKVMLHSTMGRYSFDV